MTDSCPRCGEVALTSGYCVRNLGADSAARFEPDEMGSFPLRFQRGIRLQSRFTACLCCGMVWAHVLPEELRTLIQRHGKPEAVARVPSE